MANDVGKNNLIAERPGLLWATFHCESKHEGQSLALLFKNLGIKVYAFTAGRGVGEVIQVVNAKGEYTGEWIVTAYDERFITFGAFFDRFRPALTDGQSSRFVKASEDYARRLDVGLNWRDITSDDLLRVAAMREAEPKTF